jgi:hypothetical protein
MRLTRIRSGFIVSLTPSGASVYAQALSSPLCHRLYLTRIHSAVEGDVCFPPWDESLYFLEKSTESFEENSLKFSFQVFSRKNAAISLLDYSCTTCELAFAPVFALVPVPLPVLALLPI